MAKSQAAPAEFTYEGKDRNGKRVKGSTFASTPTQAKAELRKKGIIPIKITKKSQSLFSRNKKITSADLSVFFRQMATMMKAGVSLIEAFNIMASSHNNPAMRTLLNTIRESIESGTSLADSLNKHPEQFDSLTVNLLEAGEQSGALDTMLDRIATYKEKTEALRSKVKKAMIYPIAVLVVAFAVSAVLLIFVVPQFQSLFANFGADLPVFTQMVINLSEMLQSYWYILLIIIGGGFYAFNYAKKTSRKFAEFLDRLVLKIYVVGTIIEKSILARFARTLATTFAAGVPLLESLQSVAGAMGNSVYTEAVHRIIDDVSTGTQLNAAMRSTQLFPSLMLQMVAIGEEAGSLDEMLSKVADFLEGEVDDLVDGLSSLLEPIIIVVLGVMIGGLIVAMYLPIFKMGSVVG